MTTQYDIELMNADVADIRDYNNQPEYVIWRDCGNGFKPVARFVNEKECAEWIKQDRLHARP